MLTTAEAAALATERGYPIKGRTVKQWALRGYFPNAQSIGEGKGRRWLIPREDFEAFIATRTPPHGREEGEG